MKTFNNLGSFADHLKICVDKYSEYESKAAFVMGEELKEKAQKKIGYLQESAGQFEAWQPLAESTKSDKERQGYVFNSEYNPLYRTGELKESIGHVFNKIAKDIILGSTSQIMVYQEEGTKYIPKRSVIGATMYQATMWADAIFIEMLLYWIMGKRYSPKKLKLVKTKSEITV